MRIERSSASSTVEAITGAGAATVVMMVKGGSARIADYRLLSIAVAQNSKKKM
jgi:hypothetical protein